MSRPSAPRPAREIAVALLVPAGVFGFVRVFADIDAVLPMVGAALLSSLVATACRRRGLPLLPSALVSLVGLAALVILRYAGGTTTLGIVPTGETLEALDLLVQDGMTQFRELRAPVPDLAPFVAFAIIGAWIMAFLTDWGAQRLRLAFEPVLPAGLLFAFSAVLGAGERRLLATTVFTLAVLAWAVVQRTDRVSESAPWLTADARRGPAAVARTAAVTGVAVVLIGALVGPQLPGADDEELFDWRARTDPTRTVVSPFVEIGDRLVDQVDIPLFTVAAEQPSYWRLAGLDTYDAENAAWSTRLRFDRADGALPGTAQASEGAVTVTQQITIQGLRGIWLPAAFAPSRIVESDTPTTWNTDTASLAVPISDGGSGELVEGQTYTIESVVPVWEPDRLRAADPDVPVEIAERYLAIPSDLSPRVRSQAEEITAGATSRYEQALALQEYFRQFDYSVRLPPREGDPIEQFLDERVGFCQQFSGTFALMARSLGIPTRVAVGFTWGDPVSGEGGLYQVSGRHTHAWPEVWFADLGWVAFEPTPGRGAPLAAHTNVGEAQDSLVQPSFDAEPEVEAGSALDPSLDTPDFEAFDPQLDTEADPAFAGATDDGVSIPGPWWLWAALAAVVVYAAAAPWWFRQRRRRRRGDGGDAARRIEALWADVGDDLAFHHGIVRTPSETRTEFAGRLADDARLPEGELAVLADAVTAARFGGPTAAAFHLERAEAAAEAIRRHSIERIGAVQRWRVEADPRHLVGAATRRPVDPS